LEFKRFAVHRPEQGVVRVVERVSVVDEVARFEALELILHSFTTPKMLPSVPRPETVV